MENVQVSETGLAIVERHDALSINRAPDVVLEEARKAAVALKDVIDHKEHVVKLNGKTYLQFEDWQTLGRFYGVTAMCRETKYVEYGEGEEKVTGFEARAEALLVGTNQVISSAEALCLNDEPNWTRKPKFQLKSMAQTRACAKALRNVLSWVVVLAGYAPTPAEEMDSVEVGFKQPQRKSQPIPTAEQGPEVLNAVFADTSPDPEQNDFTDIRQASKSACPHKRIQPAGISKTGNPYKSFCRDCKVTLG